MPHFYKTVLAEKSAKFICLSIELTQVLFLIKNHRITWAGYLFRLTQTMKQNSISSIAVLVFSACAITSSHAQTITFNTPVGTAIGAAGLNDSVYHNAAITSTDPNDADISSVESYAASTTPDYTFVNGNCGFNYAASSVTADYLGADAAGAASSDTTSTGYTLFDALGYINVSLAEVNQVFNFSIGQADDGARVTIGGDGTPGSGTTICEQDYGGQLSDPSQDVIFTAPGAYAIEILTYQTVGGLDFTLNTTLNGSSTQPDYTTSATPEPSTWALMTVGLLGLPFFRQLRKRQPLN